MLVHWRMSYLSHVICLLMDGVARDAETGNLKLPGINFKLSRIAILSSSDVVATSLTNWALVSPLLTVSDTIHQLGLGFESFGTGFMALHDLWWVLVLSGDWWWSLVNAGDLWWFLMLLGGLWWVLVLPGDLWWVPVLPGDVWWVLVISSDCWWSLVLTGECLVTSDHCWWSLVTAGDLW